MLRLVLTSTFLIASNIYTKNMVDIITDTAAEAISNLLRIRCP